MKSMTKRAIIGLVTLRFLRKLAIPVVSEDVGGHRGRKIVFRTSDGTSEVRLFDGGGLGRA